MSRALMVGLHGLLLLVAPPAHAAPGKIIFVHLHSGERLAVDPQALPSPRRLNRFLRCRSARKYTLMDPRLVLAAAHAARHFRRSKVAVLSAFRSAEVNLTLYKKGHKVALRSRHMAGQALDLRIPGVAIDALCRYFRSMKLIGGVGCYRRLNFVHIDVGPRRRWAG